MMTFNTTKVHRYLHLFNSRLVVLYGKKSELFYIIKKIRIFAI